MDESTLQLRIRVVLVSTRVAVRSLPPGNGQVSDVLQRGLQLLEGLEPEVLQHGSDETQERLVKARAELISLAK